MKKYIVITTINPITKAIKTFKNKRDWNIILVGDKKSTPIKSENNITYLSVEKQNNLGYESNNICPYNHYARKNIGYLYAIQNDADIIYDTDDDNYPNDKWNISGKYCKRKIKNINKKNKFFNVYRYFSNDIIWPRGYPLDEINNKGKYYIDKTENNEIGIWQGLAENDPDVDAIYRLIYRKKIKYIDKPSICLGKRIFSPFNSQSTFWFKNAFLFLYLPSTISVRATDIFRSYIAQKLLWELNLHLGFNNCNVFHERNEHNNLNDFKHEVYSYLNIKKLVNILDSINFDCDIVEKFYAVYRELIENKILGNKEMKRLDAWVSDYKRFIRTNGEK